MENVCRVNVLQTAAYLVKEISKVLLCQLLLGMNDPGTETREHRQASLVSAAGEREGTHTQEKGREERANDLQRPKAVCTVS